MSVFYFQGSLECTIALLDAGAPLNGSTSLWDMTPLAVACQFGHYEIVRLLLERYVLNMKS